MAVDIRINNVQTDFNVVDASALLTPAVRDQIVREVLRALEQRQREQREREVDTALGSKRDQE